MNDALPQKILPPATDLSQPFREGCRSGELRLQYCGACDRHQFYPRIICSGCGGDELEWRAVSGRGRIASYTVVRRAISRAYEAPYVVALVELEEGPRMMSAIVGAEPEAVSVGAPVAVRFADWGADHVLPVFELTAEETKEEPRHGD